MYRVRTAHGKSNNEIMKEIKWSTIIMIVIKIFLIDILKIDLMDVNNLLHLLLSNNSLNLVCNLVAFVTLYSYDHAKSSQSTLIFSVGRIRV